MRPSITFFLSVVVFLSILHPSQASIPQDAEKWFSNARRHIPRFSFQIIKTGRFVWPPVGVPPNFDAKNPDYLESILWMNLFGAIPALLLLIIGPAIFLCCCGCSGSVVHEEAPLLRFEHRRISICKRATLAIVALVLWGLAALAIFCNVKASGEVAAFHTQYNAARVSIRSTGDHLCASLSTLQPLTNASLHVPQHAAAAHYFTQHTQHVDTAVADTNTMRMALLVGSFGAIVFVSAFAMLGLCCPRRWSACAAVWFLILLAWVGALAMLLAAGVHFSASVPVVDLCPWIDIAVRGNWTTAVDSLLPGPPRSLVNGTTAALDALGAQLEAKRAGLVAKLSVAPCTTVPLTAECAAYNASLVAVEGQQRAASQATGELAEYANCTTAKHALPGLHRIACVTYIAYDDVLTVILVVSAAIVITLLIPCCVRTERVFRGLRESWKEDVQSTYVPQRGPSTPMPAYGTLGSAPASIGVAEADTTVFINV